MKAVFFALATLGLANSSAIAAQSASLFGVEVGRKLSLPLCDHNAEGVMEIGAYDEAAMMCAAPDYQTETSWSDIENGVFLVHFPTGGTPDISRNSVFKVTTEDGRVRGISVDTRGIADQKQVMSALRRKFGKPTRTVVEHRSNLMGAKIDVLFSSWNFADGSSVSFQGMTDEIDHGLISAYSKNVSDEAASILAHRAKVTPSL